MQKSTHKHQHGFAHVIAIVLVVGIIGALGYVGLRALNKDTSIGDIATKKVASIAASKECMDEYDDKDLCKFISSWNINEKFMLESTYTSEGQTVMSTMTIDGDRSYYKMDGGGYVIEMITVSDNTTYTKAGEIWWKQTTEKVDKLESAPSKDDFKFDEPEADTGEKDLTKYVKIGQEVCGDLNCFKYQVIDPDFSDTTEYIWFDDKDYLIRRSLTESSDGTKSESLFSYDNISVSEPSPVKELGSNQYIAPGQTEPQTMHEMMN